ncbi:MAG TPA: serpin family protein [Polyangia bacterium]|nr:serpin family protein [Polyangia bacterium]
MVTPLAALGFGCDGAPGGPLPIKTARSSEARILRPTVVAGDATMLAAENATFAVQLYGALSAQPGNVVLSPTSLSLAMATVYAGARDLTADQIATTLHFTLPAARLHPAFDALDLALNSRAQPASDGSLPLGTDGQPFALWIKNALWADQRQTLEPAFLDVLAENYGAGVQQVDFVGAPEPARLTINQWVAAETNGKIADLLPAGLIDPQTRLVLTDAVYLNAAWQTPFTEPTMNYPFHRADGSDVSVPMMRGKTGFSMAIGAGYHAAELTYSGKALSMVVIVPDAGTFAAFEAAFTAEQLAAILAALAPSGQGLLLPKFQFTLAFSLRDTLSALGMPAAFSPTDANFSAIDDARDLFVRDVVHKTFIAVTEKGTEAAAATGAVQATMSAVTLLAVDRPFLFLIRDHQTGALLFLGRVVDPSAP